MARTPQLSVLHRPVHRYLNTVYAERFYEIVQSAGSTSFDGIFNRAVAGNHYHIVPVSSVLSFLNPIDNPSNPGNFMSVTMRS